MPVGLSPAAAPTIKFKSIAISVSYPNLSTLSFPPKAARAAGYLANDSQPISVCARIAVFLCSAFLFAAVIERYHCSARRIGEACDDLGRDGLSLDGARSLGMRCGPDTLLKAFERKLTFL